jgi:hypothetical protein
MAALLLPHNGYHKNIALPESKPLKFSSQAAPIKKSKPKFPILEVPEATMKYMYQAFTKLFTPNTKHPVTSHLIETMTILETQQTSHILCMISPSNNDNTAPKPREEMTTKNGITAKVQAVKLTPNTKTHDWLDKRIYAAGSQCQLKAYPFRSSP